MFLTGILALLVSSFVPSLTAENRSPETLPANRYTQAPERLAAAMPDWWKLGFEERGRLDTFTGLSGLHPDFRDTAYLHRFRLNSTITVRPWLKLVGQLQDSRAFDYDRSPVPANMQNPFDLRLGYADIGLGGEQGWAARIGRQKLTFGDMRLIGNGEWGNVPPAYDGLMVSHSSSAARLDLFSMLVATPQSGFDRPKADRKLSGVHSTFQVRRWNAAVDAYTFWKSNLRALDEGFHMGHLDIYTSGVRATGKLPAAFDYNVEMAMQRGHISGDALRAWSGHWELGHRLNNLPGGPRFWLEHNFASGDSSNGDGRRQAFEQLYPTPWNVVGRPADFASRNLQEPLLGMEWQASRRWKLRSSLRAFWLASTNDALYVLSGAIYARNPNATAKRVGEEAGGWVICQVNSRVQFWLGYSHLFPGPFLKQAGKGNAVNYPFVLWMYRL